MKFRLILGLIFVVLFKSSYAQSTPQVVVSIKPIHSIVESLMDGIASPELLLKSNNSAHTFHLKPSQIRMIEDADLVISIGDQFEIGLRKALKNLDSKNRVEIMSLNNLVLHQYRADKIYDKDHQEHDQETSTYDMHLWLDINNMKKIAHHIYLLLVDVDPVNTNRYNQNLQLLTSKLDALETEIEAQMHPFSSKINATFSDTIQYFEKKYRLGRPVIVTPYHGARLSINRTLASKNTMNDFEVSCLIYGTEVRKSQISVLSEGLSLKVHRIDILGQEFSAGPEQYFNLMKKFSNQVASCLK